MFQFLNEKFLKLLSIIIIVIIAVINDPIRASAALDDFKKGVGESGKRNTGSSSGGSSSKKGSSFDSNDDNDDDCISSCMGDIITALGMIWYSHNFLIYYSDYPYSDPEKNSFINAMPYIFLKSDNELADNRFSDNGIKGRSLDHEKDPVEKEKNIRPNLSDYKHYFYTLDSGYKSCGDDGSGGFVSLRGRFWKYLGPEFEAMRISDGKDHLAYYAAGANIPLFQNSYFSPDFYLQAVYLRGVIDMSGVAYGIIINSYPFRPVTLFLRAGQHLYTKDEYSYKFIDLEGRIGLILYRFEIFAGYRRLKTEYAELKGPFTGIKFYF